MQVSEQLALSFEERTDCYIANHALLGVKKQLPDTGKAWTLHFDKSDVAFFVSGEDRVWSSVFFGASVVDIEGELYVVKGPDDAVELQQHRSAHVKDHIDIEIPLGKGRLFFF